MEEGRQECTPLVFFLYSLHKSVVRFLANKSINSKSQRKMNILRSFYVLLYFVIKYECSSKVIKF